VIWGMRFDSSTATIVEYWQPDRDASARSVSPFFSRASLNLRPSPLDRGTSPGALLVTVTL